MFTAIWAQDEKGLIGKENHLPWRLPNDLKFFKEKTLGQTIVMGRKTFEGMGARPLPNRKTILLTQNKALQDRYKEVVVLTSVEEVVAYAKSTHETIFIVGGSSIYKAFEGQITTIYRTLIHASFEGDSYFPQWNWAKYQLVNETQGVVDEGNKYAHTFQTFMKKE